MKLFTFLTLAVCVATNQSCMTTYSAKGYPVQSVDPGVATAAIIGAGAVGFVLGSANYGCEPYYGAYGQVGYFRPYSHGHYSCY
jgi:hypothetical protein